MEKPDHSYEVKIGNMTYAVSSYYAGEVDIAERIGNLIYNATEVVVHDEDNYFGSGTALKSSGTEKIPVDVPDGSRYSVAVRDASGKEDT